jgi:hypothetical protein
MSTCPSFAAAPLLNAKDLKKAPFATSLETLRKQGGGMNVLWICGEKAKTTLTARCDETGNDELVGDEREWARAILEIRAATPIANYNYGLRHGVQVGECKKMLRDIRKIQKKDLPYCILGDYVSEHRTESKIPKINSIFFLLKSPLGYVTDMDY